jgi:hypothetical protein
MTGFWIQEGDRKMCLEGGFSTFWARFLAPDKFLVFFGKILPV